MMVAVVDFGLGNLRSLINAFECFAVDVRVTDSPAEIEQADKIVLPGVGAFDAGMRGLRERGLVEVLDSKVLGKTTPILGVCLGMQLILQGSEEGELPGLGWIDRCVVSLGKDVPGIKIPHIGWSEVQLPKASTLFNDMESPLDFYFVHSYCLPRSEATDSIAVGVAEHGVPFVAAYESGNIMGVQFHPEKSQLAGMKLLENFLAS